MIGINWSSAVRRLLIIQFGDQNCSFGCQSSQNKVPRLLPPVAHSIPKPLSLASDDGKGLESDHSWGACPP